MVLLNKKGVTLNEVIVVLAILTILSAIAIPRFLGFTATAKEQVCYSNCITIERGYEAYLTFEKLEHTDILFSQYLTENNYEPCPNGGIISNIDGEVCCSIHSPDSKKEEETEEDTGEEVPFL